MRGNIVQCALRDTGLLPKVLTVPATGHLREIPALTARAASALALLALLVPAVSLQAQTTAADPAPAAAAAPATATNPASSAGASQVLNDTATWLAGLALDTNPSVSQAQRETDEAWAALRRSRLEPMEAFAAKHFAAERKNCATLFYPFGGPDMLNALGFFPNCQRYVLFGLEPVGELPVLAKLDDEQKALVLADMHKAQQYILRRNFFVTQYMSEDLNTPHLKGILPIVTTTLVRMGYVILDIVAANVDGSTPPTAGRHPRAVFVHFQARSGGPVQELVYASFDASDTGLEKNPLPLHLLEPLAPTATLLKAASYLLHDTSFARMRSLVAAKSPLLIQDDSGMPYAALLADGYSVELYGNYVSTIPAFSYRFQKDLAQAYATQPVHARLAFPWSYAWKRAEASLQIARKTGS